MSKDLREEMLQKAEELYEQISRGQSANPTHWSAAEKIAHFYHLLLTLAKGKTLPLLEYKPSPKTEFAAGTNPS